MKKILLNRYVWLYAAIYVGTIVLMSVATNYNAGEAVAILLIIGIGFTSVAHLITRKFDVPQNSNLTTFRSKDVWTIGGLLVWIILYLTVWKSYFNGLFGNHAQLESCLNILGKLFTFVLVPALVYKFVCGFNAEELGFTSSWKNLFTGRYVITFVALSSIILLFQFFVGKGAAPIRQGIFTAQQLSVAVPLSFLWLFFEVGLVEEFFFRVLLQSRFKALTNSTIGGIIPSGLIFGVSHAPGIYLRGAGARDGIGGQPDLLTAIGFTIVVLSSAGFFLGLVWERTRNLWLICALHAIVDLLPFVPKFIPLWGV